MAIVTEDLDQDVDRFRCQACDIMAAVDSATVIEKGDMLWLDTDDVKPASDLAWNEDEDTTRADFIAKFMGIAMQKSENGETADIRVRCKHIFKFDIDAAPAADLEIGTLVGPAKHGSENKLLNQVLKNAATTKGIGHLQKVCKTTDITMQVEIMGHYVPTPAA